MAEKTSQNRPTGSIVTEERPYNCRLCSKMYRTKGQLKRHIVHSARIKTHKCSLCGKAFRTRQALTVHASVHSDVKPYTCKECKATFKRETTLINHTRQHGQELCLCEVCGKTFKTKDNLANHRVVHSKDRRFKCTKCTLTFKRNSELTQHTSVHSDEKLHSCDQCGQSFTRLSSLNVLHKLPQYQANEIAYSCDQCSEVFRHKCGLKAHQRIHAAERKKTNPIPNPHLCQLCGRSYTAKSSLKRHLKTHAKRTSSAQNEGRCDDPDRPTVFTSTILHEELLGTPALTIRGIPYPSQTFLEDHSNVITVQEAVFKTDRDIQGRRKAGNNPLVYPSATRETEDAIRVAPEQSSQSDSGRTRLGRFTTPSLNRYTESNQRGITFWEEEIGQVPVSDTAQPGTECVAERAAAGSGSVPSLVPSELLEEVNNMKDGVEARNACNINHHLDPHIQQYRHRLQQQQVAEELLQMVKTGTPPTDPTTSGRSERMHH